MKRRVLDYYLTFSPGAVCRVTFRIEGVPTPIILDFLPAEFAVVAAVLAIKGTAFDTSTKTFVAYNDYTNNSLNA